MQRDKRIVWAEFRFAIIGRLLFSQFDKNQLAKKINHLSTIKWKHPISGELTHFGHSSIERWYYKARHAIENGKSPIESLGKKRSDSGKFTALTKEDKSNLQKQYNKQRLWGCKDFLNYLTDISKKRSNNQTPSYHTVWRYIKHLESYGRKKDAKYNLEKSKKIIAKLRRTLIVKSSQSFIFRCTNERLSNHFHQTLLFIKLNCYEKKYLIDALERYKRAGGSQVNFCKEIGKGECTVQR